MTPPKDRFRGPTRPVRRSRRILERVSAARKIERDARDHAQKDANRKALKAKHAESYAKEQSYRIVLQDPEPNPVKRIPKIAQHLIDKFEVHDIDFRFYTGGFWIGRPSRNDTPIKWFSLWPYTITAAQIEKCWNEIKPESRQWLPTAKERAELKKTCPVTEQDILQWEYTCDFTLRVKGILEKHGISVSDSFYNTCGYEVLYHEDNQGDEDNKDDENDEEDEEDEEDDDSSLECGYSDVLRPSSFNVFVVLKCTNFMLGPFFHHDDDGPIWGPYIIEAPGSGPEEAAKNFEADLQKSIDQMGKKAILNWLDSDWRKDLHDPGWCGRAQKQRKRMEAWKAKYEEQQKK